MAETLKVENYTRRVTPLERIFSRSPFSIVAVVARIKGSVSEDMLLNAVSKIQQRHTLLRVRSKEDTDRNPWFTSEGIKEIPVKTISRESDDQWIEVYNSEIQIPFEFEERPPIRFILVQSPDVSELIILCHHIICDGMSLAFLARDSLIDLGDPVREVEVLPDPVPIGMDNIPKEVSLNAIFRFVIKRINRKWEKDKIFFDQEDYKDLSQAYWKNSRHRMLTVELSAEQTSDLAERCRRRETTVNTALTAAFAGAQCAVQGRKKTHPSIGIAGNLRDKMEKPAGAVMGFYAGLVTLKYKYNIKRSFWENARRLHRKIRPRITNKNLFGELLLWCHLDPAILESLNFKMLGGLVPSGFSRYRKISAFNRQNDVVSSLLKRKKMNSLNRVFMGTAVTNLTSLDFPRTYGSLELDRLIMQPGGAFPLGMVNLVLGAVTCAGKLSIVIEYAEETVDTASMEKMRDKALEFLLGDR